MSSETRFLLRLKLYLKGELMLFVDSEVNGVAPVSF